MLVVVVLAGHLVHATLLIPPLAASSALVAARPGDPLAQPRNVVGGHVFSCLVGVLVGRGTGHGPGSAAIAGGVALGVMTILRIVHMPGVATAVIVVAARVPVLRLMGSVLLAALVIVGCGLIVSRICGRVYPASRW
jgi:CBS-domain-containing membrane protein